MKIRSITCFFDPRSPQAYAQLDNLAKLAEEGQTLFTNSGIEVQTRRLSTVPFPLLYPTEETASAVQPGTDPGNRCQTARLHPPVARPGAARSPAQL